MIENKQSLIQATSLQQYFYDNLIYLNQKSLCPVPLELIYYSSHLMEKFSLSNELYDQSNGKARDKILGLKLLESNTQSPEEQIKTYKEIGDVSLFLCGYFGKSMSKKIHDIEYYVFLGKKAYLSLDRHVPIFLDIPSFYKNIATCYESLIVLLSKVASFDKSDPYRHLIMDHTSEKDLLVQGIQVPKTQKAS